jgi:hypothetical protein
MLPLSLFAESFGSFLYKDPYFFGKSSIARLLMRIAQDINIRTPVDIFQLMLDMATQRNIN